MALGQKFVGGAGADSARKGHRKTLMRAWSAGPLGTIHTLHVLPDLVPVGMQCASRRVRTNRSLEQRFYRFAGSKVAVGGFRRWALHGGSVSRRRLQNRLE